MSLAGFAFLPVLCLPGVVIESETLGAALGRLKGRPFEGFMLGFFLGPLGCLLVAFGRGRTPDS